MRRTHGDKAGAAGQRTPRLMTQTTSLPFSLPSLISGMRTWERNTSARHGRGKAVVLRMAETARSAAAEPRVCAQARERTREANLNVGQCLRPLVVLQVCAVAVVGLQLVLAFPRLVILPQSTAVRGGSKDQLRSERAAVAAARRACLPRSPRLWHGPFTYERHARGSATWHCAAPAHSWPWLATRPENKRARASEQRRRKQSVPTSSPESFCDTAIGSGAAAPTAASSSTSTILGSSLQTTRRQIMRWSGSRRPAASPALGCARVRRRGWHRGGDSRTLAALAWQLLPRGCGPFRF